MRSIAALGALAVLLSLPAAGSAGEVEGHLEIDGEALVLSHVTAWRFPGSTRVIVVLSDAPLPEGEMYPDPSRGSQGLVLFVKDDGEVRSMHAYMASFDPGEVWQLNGAAPILFEPAGGGEGSISGRAWAPGPDSGLHVLEAFEARFTATPRTPPGAE